MNIKLSRTLIIVFTVLVVGLPAAAWGQATETGDISAEVLDSPISLAQNPALYFGSFYPYGRPGTIVISNDGIHYTDLWVENHAQPAAWHIRGACGAYYDIAHSGDTTLSNGGDTMEVSDIHTWGVTGVLGNCEGGVGGEGIGLGATLSVNANQPPGFYTGTYTITAAYN